MTREEILAMEPGRELDRLIRIHLFGDIDESWGWKEWWGEHWITDNKEVATWFELPKYSTDLSAAWEVVEKLKIRITPQSPSAPEELSFMAEYGDYEFKKTNYVFAKTAPEAICKAALLAVLEG